MRVANCSEAGWTQKPFPDERDRFQPIAGLLRLSKPLAGKNE